MWIVWTQLMTWLHCLKTHEHKGAHQACCKRKNRKKSVRICITYFIMWLKEAQYSNISRRPWALQYFSMRHQSITWGITTNVVAPGLLCMFSTKFSQLFMLSVIFTFKTNLPGNFKWKKKPSFKPFYQSITLAINLKDRQSKTACDYCFTKSLVHEWKQQEWHWTSLDSILNIEYQQYLFLNDVRITD